MSDVLILGAGMVGIATALELQGRGYSVRVIDRQSPGRETSHGNAGIIQVEAAEPYALPRNPAKLLQMVLGRTNDLTWSIGGLLANAPALWQYFRHSAPQRHRRLSMSYARLTSRANRDHQVWIDAASARALIRRRGYCCVYRDPASLDAAVHEMEHLQQTYGVHARPLDGAAYRAEEPCIREAPAGAIHWADCWTCSDPGDLTRRYAELFMRQGGDVLLGDAFSLRQTGTGWSVQGYGGSVSARHVVVALGPWAPALLRCFGYRIPMILKRGYHAHYQTKTGLRRPLFDVDHGVVASPMTRGLRVCTGAALVKPDAPADTRQITRGVAGLSSLLEIGERIAEPQWHGSRPCMPDMLPVVGESPDHPGLWFNFGHGHQGFTLGPTTACILADAMQQDARTQAMQKTLAPRGRF